jgi:hypothetical protein
MYELKDTFRNVIVSKHRSACMAGHRALREDRTSEGERRLVCLKNGEPLNEFDTKQFLLGRNRI